MDVGGAFHPNDRSDQIAAKMDENAGTGTFTAVYRVVSADGHPVAGGFTFAVGKRSGNSRTPGLAALTEAESQSGVSVDGALGFARFVQFAAICLALGLVLFLLGIWRPAARESAGGAIARRTRAFEARLGSTLRVVAAAGLVASVLGIAAQGALASGLGLGAAIDGGLFTRTLGTRFGWVWGLGALCWVVVFVVGGKSVSSRRVSLTAPMAAAVAFLSALPALAGHASTSKQLGLLAPVSLVHVVAAGIWLGGLTALVAVCSPVLQGLGSAERVRAQSDLVRRYSAVAIWAVAALAFTGVVQALFGLDEIGQVVASPYGRAILVKVGLFAGLVAVAGVQRWAVVAHIGKVSLEGERAQRKLSRLMKLEIGLLAGVFVATSALASYSPDLGGASGPVSRATRIGPAQLQLTVDPATAGENQIHIYLFDRGSGAQFERASEVTVREVLSSPEIGPITQRAQRAGPGHWIIPDAVFSPAGEWKLRVGVRSGEFDLDEASVTVRVR